MTRKGYRVNALASGIAVRNGPQTVNRKGPGLVFLPYFSYTDRNHDSDRGKPYQWGREKTQNAGDLYFHFSMPISREQAQQIKAVDIEVWVRYPNSPNRDFKLE